MQFVTNDVSGDVNSEPVFGGKSKARNGVV